MKTMQGWLDEYAVSHQNKTNKQLHFICVPLIFFSVLGLLWSIPSSFMNSWLPESFAEWFNFSTIVVFFGLIFYLRLSFKMFLGFVLVCALSLSGIRTFDHLGVLLYTSLGIFVSAWIGQFIGHKIEGAKPSFLEDIQFLLIGPAWIMSFLYKKAGISY